MPRLGDVIPKSDLRVLSISIMDCIWEKSGDVITWGASVPALLFNVEKGPSLKAPLNQ